jgi:hypothetical protein
MPPKLFRQGISRYRSEPFRTDSTKRESARNNNNTVRERCPHDHERSAAQLQRDPVRAQANRALFQGCSLNGASCPLTARCSRAQTLTLHKTASAMFRLQLASETWLGQVVRAALLVTCASVRNTPSELSSLTLGTAHAEGSSHVRRRLCLERRSSNVKCSSDRSRKRPYEILWAILARCALRIECDPPESSSARLQRQSLVPLRFRGKRC